MKIRFLSLLALLFPTYFFAQESTQQHAPTADENSLLWEISGKGLAQPSYLFGTIHMINKDDFILTDDTKATFSKSKKVVFEINTEEMFDLGTQFSLLMKSFMENGKRLRDLVSAEDYKLVEAHFDKIGMPLMLLERVKPMILSVFASEDIGSGKMASTDIKSYEIELTQMAKEQKKLIDGLETVDFQMSMFDSIPYDVQAKMLVETLKSEDAGDDQFEKMVELYKNQDLSGMQTMILSEKDGIGKYDELLLVNRNKNWIPKMEKIMPQQPTFFAVGAGHLAGESGVIALLRKEGYTLRPIRSK